MESAVSARYAASRSAPRRNDVGIAPPSRRDLFAGLFVIGLANALLAGLAYQVVTGPTAALGALAGVSVVVWIAAAVALWMMRRMSEAPASARDLRFAVAALLLFALPPAPLNWLGLTATGLYLAATAKKGAPGRRAGLIITALCVPMFWSKILMSAMSDMILRFDAALAGILLNAERTGNAVAFADGSGHFWIAPECSSLANISIAILCWVVLGQGVSDRRPPGFGYCAAAIVAVVTLNVARIALTGISRTHYVILHGPVGDFVFDFLSVAAMAAILALGWRRGAANMDPRHVALG